MASQFAEFTTIAQNIIVSICGIATAIIAYLGLTAWRKELKGKSEYEKAKEVLKAAYRVRSAVSHVRHPIIHNSEYPQGMVDETGHLTGENDLEGKEEVYKTRWKVLTDAFGELEEHCLEGQIEWGPEFKDVIVPLRKCR